MQQNLSLDFILSFCRDKVPGRGEDSYCYSFCDTAGMLGVFDGCGGAGAKTHDFYSGHTEAYMAARFCAGVFYDQFRKLFPNDKSAEELVRTVFAPALKERLTEYSPPQSEDGIQIKGSSVRVLPSTAAVALMREVSGGVEVSAIWAGDSRVYVLSTDGLAQLTMDETSVPDPMLTLYEDGILRNVVCADKPVALNCKTITMDKPFLVFTATDGCFGYLSTPMEFEGIILQALLSSDNVIQWEKALADYISSVAGDDHTLCMAAYGFGNFEKLQRSFEKHYHVIKDCYLEIVSSLPVADQESRFKLWESYRKDYMKYIEGGQG